MPWRDVVIVDDQDVAAPDRGGNLVGMRHGIRRQPVGSAIVPEMLLPRKAIVSASLAQ